MLLIPSTGMLTYPSFSFVYHKCHGLRGIFRDLSLRIQYCKYFGFGGICADINLTKGTVPTADEQPWAHSCDSKSQGMGLAFVQGHFGMVSEQGMAFNIRYVDCDQDHTVNNPPESFQSMIALPIPNSGKQNIVLE